jgi:hypothetical protein
MTQIIMDHGVSACFGTMLAPKHCSQSFKKNAGKDGMATLLGVLTKDFLLTSDLGQDASFPMHDKAGCL